MAIEDRKGLGEAGIWFADVFQQALAQSLEAMTTEQPKVEWAVLKQEDWTPKAAEGWSWWEQPVTAAPGTTLWLGIGEADWGGIGKFALAAAGIDDATPEDCLSTWKEIGNQALSSSASALGKKLKKEVNCGAGKGVTGTPAMEVCVSLTVQLADSQHRIHFGWNSAVQQVLAPPAETKPAQAAPAAAAQPASPQKQNSAAVENSRTLGLLLEVELPVSVSFGRAQLPLKDVLKLNSGSIVELNRAIAEPVEVIVNNCVIARGEVVVVEGNYGVRIKQIISKEERLRTLY